MVRTHHCRATHRAEDSSYGWCLCARPGTARRHPSRSLSGRCRVGSRTGFLRDRGQAGSISERISRWGRFVATRLRSAESPVQGNSFPSLTRADRDARERKKKHRSTRESGGCWRIVARDENEEEVEAKSERKTRVSMEMRWLRDGAKALLNASRRDGITAERRVGVAQKGIYIASCSFFDPLIHGTPSPWRWNVRRFFEFSPACDSSREW